MWAAIPASDRELCELGLAAAGAADTRAATRAAAASVERGRITR